MKLYINDEIYLLLPIYLLTQGGKTEQAKKER